MGGGEVEFEFVGCGVVIGRVWMCYEGNASYDNSG